MKKLKLNLQNLEGVELLSREQLKRVTGGGGSSGGCNSADDCPEGETCANCPDGYKCLPEGQGGCQG